MAPSSHSSRHNIAASPSGLTRAWAVLRDAYLQFTRHSGGLMAAAISYYLILSLVPLLLVASAVIGYVVGSSASGAAGVMRFVDQHLLPSAGVQVHDLLGQLVAKKETIGGIGLVGLLWSGIQGFVTLQEAINVVWERPPRPFVPARLFAGLMLLVLGALFFATTGITSAQTALGALHGFGWVGAGWFSGALTAIVAVAISTVMFSFIYRYFPSGGAAWRPALLSGLTVAVAWEIAKHAFAYYLGHLAHFDALYGSMGSLIGLVVWIYYSSFLLIYGSEIALRLQEPVRAKAVAGTPASQPRQMKPASRRRPRAGGRSRR